MAEWETRADAEGRQRGTAAFWAGPNEWAAERPCSSDQGQRTPTSVP